MTLGYHHTLGAAKSLHHPRAVAVGGHGRRAAAAAEKGAHRRGGPAMLRRGTVALAG